jgi:hypothetical protein
MNRRDALKQTALMMGYTLSSSTLASILNSCKSDPGLAWEPVFFSEPQAKTISAMTEGILPKTDTPGAREVMADRFVDKMVAEVLSREEQGHFMEGMKSFEQECEQTYGKSFKELSEDQQTELLNKYDQQTTPMMGSIWGFSVEPVDGPPPFFRVLKDFTLLGYFNSEEVAHHILSYDPVPGAYLPCIPLAEAGNAWAE